MSELETENSRWRKELASVRLDIDSSPLAVCDNLRISRHRVFAKVAARGKSSTGWFYGLKLHVAMNHRDELLSIKVTPSNVDDRKPVAFLCRRLFRRVYADKGHVARWLVDLLRVRQIHPPKFNAMRCLESSP